VILGKALKLLDVPRDRVVIATKVFGPVFDDITRFSREGMYEDPSMVNRIGLSRKHIFDACDASLKRLDVDYIDLYQIHRFDPVSIIREDALLGINYIYSYMFKSTHLWKRSWKH
jgi:aryl-alcohol dehydrogenase-like predicted oxidoreductase